TVLPRAHGMMSPAQAECTNSPLNLFARRSKNPPTLPGVPPGKTTLFCSRVSAVSDPWIKSLCTLRSFAAIFGVVCDSAALCNPWLTSKLSVELNTVPLAVRGEFYLPAFVGFGENVAADDSNRRTRYHIMGVVFARLNPA